MFEQIKHLSNEIQQQSYINRMPKSQDPHPSLRMHLHDIDHDAYLQETHPRNGI